MKTLTTAITFVALALSPAIADPLSPAMDDSVSPVVMDVTDDPHPLVGEPPTPVQPMPQSNAASTTAAATPDNKDVLVTSLLGLPVYDLHDSELGEVVDVVLAGDGAVDAIVISVGGFLGMGQKEVALPFATVTETTNAEGNARVIVNTSSAELEAAPHFAGVEAPVPSAQ